ncbi:MAG: sulfatase-like hydrolase/transferase, partial [Verrucomicrobiaceae bacterium]|nr:sulfatase-like hydrolase/transferase [Verrucomicrobiaceae bacterium]
MKERKNATWKIIVLISSLLTLETAAKTPANILLIVSDDQGYNDIGILNPDIITPNLDRLAREGIRLTNFYVSWPACTPSRGSLMTGRYPQRNGIYDMIRNEAPDYGYNYKSRKEYEVSWEWIGGMDQREVMLPAILKPLGFKSGIYGKWDLGALSKYLPTSRGFDDFYGFVNTGIDYYTHERYGMHSMFRNEIRTMEDQGIYATNLFSREALRFLKETKDSPFFLYLPFNAPHGSSSLDPMIRGSVQAPEEFKKMYPPVDVEIVKGSRYGKPAMVPSKDARRRDYRAAVTCMDAAIGKILEKLDQQKKSNNTLVIFLSDNGGGGGANNSPLRGKKGQMWEGGLRVPCIIRWPAVLPAGKTCDEFLTSLEIFPTIAAVTGAAVDKDITLDGFNMIPVLKGQASSQRTSMFWQRRDLKAARVGNWKWVDMGNAGNGLFDLGEDPGERNNLASRKPEILDSVRKKFTDWRREMDQAP